MHSLYTTYSGKINKLSYQVGLRAEHINRKTFILVTNTRLIVGTCSLAFTLKLVLVKKVNYLQIIQGE